MTREHGTLDRDNYIYLRESKEEALRDNDRGNYSVQRMIDDCLRLATEQGIDVPLQNVIVEDAKRDEWAAPRLNRLLDLADDGRVGTLISWSADRLTGDLARGLYVRKLLADASSRLLYVHGRHDNTDEGEMLAVFEGLMGGMERKRIRRRTMSGTAGKLDKQQPVGGGRTPYGLRKVRNESGRPIAYQPDGEQVAVLDRVFALMADHPLSKIADILEADGVPTPGGTGHWSSGTLYRIVNNKTIRGMYEYGRRKFTPSRHPDGRRKYVRTFHPDEHVRSFAIEPAVDLAAFGAARAALASRKVERAARLADDDDLYTLRGRLRCGLCGGVLSCHAWGKPGARRRYYVCLKAYPREQVLKSAPDRCTLKPVPAEAIERHAWALLVSRLATRDDLDAALAEACDGGEQTRRYDDQVASTQRAIAKLERTIENGIATMLEFGQASRSYAAAKRQNQSAERELEQMEISLAELERSKPSVLQPAEAASIRVVWDEIASELGDEPPTAVEQRQCYAALGFGMRVREAGRMEPGAVRLGRVREWVLEPVGRLALGVVVAGLGGAMISQEIAAPRSIHSTAHLALWSGPDHRLTLTLATASA